MDSPAARFTEVSAGAERTLLIGRPSGRTEVVARCDDAGNEMEAGILRTARKLFDGVVFA